MHAGGKTNAHHINTDWRNGIDRDKELLQDKCFDLFGFYIYI